MFNNEFVKSLLPRPTFLNRSRTVKLCNSRRSARKTYSPNVSFLTPSYSRKHTAGQYTRLNRCNVIFCSPRNAIEMTTNNRCYTHKTVFKRNEKKQITYKCVSTAGRGKTIHWNSRCNRILDTRYTRIGSTPAGCRCCCCCCYFSKHSTLFPKRRCAVVSV